MKWHKKVAVKEHTYFVHWSFLLIPAWLVVINIIARQAPSGIIWVLLLLVLYVVSLFLHELGHYLVGRTLGYRQNQLLLLPSGAVGRVLDERFTLIEKLLIRLAGPLTNLLIAIILKMFILPYAAYWNEPSNIGVVEPGNFLFQLHLINLGLAIVNLLPVMPMDGGSMLKDILSSNPNSRKSYRVVALFSRGAAFCTLLAGIILLQVSLILLAMYVLFTCNAESNFLSGKESERHSSPNYHPSRFPFRTKSNI
ncbi:MAG: site-2 protease family protein [Chitinophagales bacterium]